MHIRSTVLLIFVCQQHYVYNHLNPFPHIFCPELALITLSYRGIVHSTV